MAYLNKVMLIGNIGKDPNVTTTSTGKKRMTFSVATSRRYKDSNGEQKEETQWHNISVWGKNCDNLEALGVKKGTQLYIEGTLTNRSWLDNATGQKKYVTEIVLDNFQLLWSRNNNENANVNNGNPYSSSNASPAERQQGLANDEGYMNGINPEDDLPF